MKDVKDTADFKIGKDGKKFKAHKIIFNDGDDENTKVQEEKMTDTDKTQKEKIVKGMKKNFKSFVNKYGKDRAEGIMHATATKMAMKEESELEEGEVPKHLQGSQKPYVSGSNGDYEVLGNKGQTKASFTRKEHGVNARKKAIAHLDKHYDTYMKEELQLTTEGNNMTSPFDWKKLVTKKDPNKETSTFHDVAKTSTGTKYTKQFDPDGISKGTGQDKAPDTAKRGRGRPKKDKFAEAFEAIANMDEGQFDQFVNSLNEEAFDAFASALKVTGE